MKMELASAKSDLEKVKRENTRLQRELEDVRKKSELKGRRNRRIKRSSRQTGAIYKKKFTRNTWNT